jgi:hypothetical protein
MTISEIADEIREKEHKQLVKYTFVQVGIYLALYIYFLIDKF